MVKRKSITALIAALVLTVSVICFGATYGYAAEADEGTSITTVDTGFTIEGTAVTGFDIPDGVTGKFELVIPDGVTVIKDSVFDAGNNNALTYNLVGVTLPASVTTIEDYAFNECRGLKTVYFNSGLKSIGRYAFTNTALTSVNVPASVDDIGQNAFYGCVSLTELTFEERTAALTVNMYAFGNCSGIVSVNIPAKTTVNQFAFNNCSSLLWVYMGEGSAFRSTTEIDDVVFFPKNTPLTIVFPSADAYNTALKDEKFSTSNGNSATYIVNVNLHVGSEVTVYERLFGREFNYVADKNTGFWNDTSEPNKEKKLPTQDSGYESTVWYSDPELTKAIEYKDVTILLASGSDVDLYCHETVPMPVLPTEPVSWVYDSKISYNATDLADVLKAMGCTQEFTDEQLNAMEFTVLFADEKGKQGNNPMNISDSGVYSVTISLKPEYGVWAQTVSSTVTVNVDTTGFNTVLIVFLIIGVLAVAVTVSTAVIRKKVQARNRKKKLSQKEVLDKFKAHGGETTLK